MTARFVERLSPSRAGIVHRTGQLVGRPDILTVGANGDGRSANGGIRESLRCYLGRDGVVRPWLFEAHLERLRSACAASGVDPSCTAELRAVMDNIFVANGIREDCYVDILVDVQGFPDASSRTALTVTVTPLARARWLATGAGIALRVCEPGTTIAGSTTVVADLRATPHDARSGPAETSAVDIEVLDGQIVGPPDAALFLIEQGSLVTPPTRTPTPSDINRSWVLFTARRLGLEVVVCDVSPEQLLRADEVLLSGTELEFGPVRSVNGVVLSQWPTCPVSTAIVDRFFQEARGETTTTEVA